MYNNIIWTSSWVIFRYLSSWDVQNKFANNFKAISVACMLSCQWYTTFGTAVAFNISFATIVLHIYGRKLKVNEREGQWWQTGIMADLMKERLQEGSDIRLFFGLLTTYPLSVENAILISIHDRLMRVENKSFICPIFFWFFLTNVG